MDQWMDQWMGQGVFLWMASFEDESVAAGSCVEGCEQLEKK